MGNIFTIQQLLERLREYNIGIDLFLDYVNVFISVLRNKLW
jgi:DNA-binding response OmpR family regulator